MPRGGLQPAPGRRDEGGCASRSISAGSGECHIACPATSSITVRKEKKPYCAFCTDMLSRLCSFRDCSGEVSGYLNYLST